MTPQNAFRLIAGVFGLVVLVPAFFVILFEFWDDFWGDINYYKEFKQQDKSEEEIAAILSFKKEIILLLCMGSVTLITFFIFIILSGYLMLDSIGMLK